MHLKQPLENITLTMSNYKQEYNCCYENNDDVYIQSFFKVRNIERVNDNCEGPIIVICERTENGKFDPLNISCMYEMKSSIIWYLKVCFIEFKKAYLYELNYSIEDENNLEWARFNIEFDINNAMDLFDPLKTQSKIVIYIFTCECYSKNCLRNPNGDQFEFL